MSVHYEKFTKKSNKTAFRTLSCHLKSIATFLQWIRNRFQHYKNPLKPTRKLKCTVKNSSQRLKYDN